jgi:hypothetical protein
MKPLSLTAEVYLDLMTKEGGVLDAIRENMSWLKESGVVIHQDGALPHGDNDFRLACAGWEHDFKFEYVIKPAQSPDMNKLDLCLFRSTDPELHALKGDGSNTEALIDAVLGQFKEYDPQKLLRAEALLYEIYRCILRHGGSNKFQIPHSYMNARHHRAKDSIEYFVSREVHLTGKTACYALLNWTYPTYLPEWDEDEDEGKEDH